MMFVLILFSTVSQYGRYTLPVGTYVLTVRTVRTDAFSFRQRLVTDMMVKVVYSYSKH